MAYIPLPRQSRLVREVTWRDTRDAAAPSSFEVRSVSRRSLPPSFPRLSLSTNTAPVPATFPDDEVTVQPWHMRPADMSTLSVYDGESTIPYQLNMPSARATDEFCARYLALIRGDAMPAAAPCTTVPRLLP